MRQSTFPLFTSLESVTDRKGLADTCRKRVERLGPEPTEEKVEAVFQYFFRDLGLDFPGNLMEELMNLAPEDEAHAGAWGTINGIAQGVQASATDREVKQYMAFLLALADIDRQLLVTRSNEDGIYWAKMLFPWMPIWSPNQFHISTLLLWASLAWHYFCISIKAESELLAPESLLMNSLPTCKDNGKPILSSDAVMQYLKHCLPQISEGTKPTFTNLALAMNINEVTVRRIRHGDALLKEKHLSSLLQQPTQFSDTFINIWTRRQKDMYEAGMDPQELVEYFSHYGDSLKRIRALYEGFKASGVICILRS